MKYLDPKFSTPANSRAYVEGWERCFGELECAAIQVEKHDDNCGAECRNSWMPGAYGEPLTLDDLVGHDCCHVCNELGARLAK